MTACFCIEATWGRETKQKRCKCQEGEADKETGQWSAREIAQQRNQADFNQHLANNNASAYPRADQPCRQTHTQKTPAFLPGACLHSPVFHFRPISRHLIPDTIHADKEHAHTLRCIQHLIWAEEIGKEEEKGEVRRGLKRSGWRGWRRGWKNWPENIEAWPTTATRTWARTRGEGLNRAGQDEEWPTWRNVKNKVVGWREEIFPQPPSARRTEYRWWTDDAEGGRQRWEGFRAWTLLKYEPRVKPSQNKRRWGIQERQKDTCAGP